MLDDMTDEELQDVRFFGYLATAPDSITFKATPDEQKRACEILKERERAAR